jgi:hypothetical protein
MKTERYENCLREVLFVTEEIELVLSNVKR